MTDNTKMREALINFGQENPVLDLDFRLHTHGKYLTQEKAIVASRAFKAGAAWQAAQSYCPSPDPVKLAELGWQMIECPICGGGAQAFPQQAAQSVPVVGEPAAWSQYAFSQNGLSSCAGSNSLVIGTSNTCSHNDCLVIGTQLTTTKHGQVLIGNKEVHQTGDISPEELSVFKDILLKTRYPAPSITAVELATLREKAVLLEEAHEIIEQYKGMAARYRSCMDERDELRKDAERLPALEHTLRHLGRELAKLDKYRLCMSYNDSYFGEPVGTVKRVVVELRHCIDAAIAQEKGE